LAGDEKGVNRLMELLNTATPYAAGSEEEVQARLAAARLRTERETFAGGGAAGSADPSSGEEDGLAVGGPDEAPPLPRGEDLYSEANFGAEYLDAADPGISDDLVDGPAFGSAGFGPHEVAPLSIDSLTPPLARAMLEGDELEQRLAVTSSDRRVEVVADVAGRIVALTLAEEARRNVHVSQLASSVCEAVNAARDRSAQLAIELAVCNHLKRS
jgi:hypothetical protein